MRKITKVAVAGAGGIGSHLTSLLFDFGMNRNQFPFTEMQIDVFDDDTVDTKNLLHQNFYEQDLGRSKVESLEERYAITPVKRFMDTKDFENYDLIFSCVDDMVFRKKLYDWYIKKADKEKHFFIDGRCESRNGVVLNASLKPEHLMARLNESTERRGCLLAEEKANNVSHTLPIIVAATMAQVFLNVLRGDPIPNEKLINI